MNIKFNRFYQEVCSRPQISYERFREILRELKLIGDFTDDLLQGIAEQLELENWGNLHRLIFVAQVAPSKKYTDILCHILDNYREHEFSDSIVDALFDIKDEKAIKSLKSIINYYERGDDDFNLNKKALYALEEIAVKDAFEAIKTALNNEHHQIRETAEEILKRKS